MTLGTGDSMIFPQFFNLMEVPYCLTVCVQRFPSELWKICLGLMCVFMCDSGAWWVSRCPFVPEASPNCSGTARYTSHASVIRRGEHLALGICIYVSLTSLEATVSLGPSTFVTMAEGQAQLKGQSHLFLVSDCPKLHWASDLPEVLPSWRHGLVWRGFAERF